jgi:hypothetical protein
MLNNERRFNCEDVHITLRIMVLTYSNDDYQKMIEVARCSLKSIFQKQPREYYSGKVLLEKTRLAMVYVTKVTCRIKDT